MKKRQTAEAPASPAKPAKQQFWGERMKEPPEMRNVAYCAGRDVAARPMADQALIPFDLWQNRAHVLMLARQGIISKENARKILEGLERFEELTNSGELQLDPRKEDVHTNIEHFVAGLEGTEVSGVMHTGRSRNDQTTTVVRLYVRQRVLEFAQALAELVRSIQALAAKHLQTPIAGFTHYQPASVTTLGHWFAAYSQALLRDLQRLAASYERLSVSPLGAAASFGTSWPIDRSFSARLMGFSSVQSNSLDCVTNRWEMEADAASAVAFAVTHLSILSQDMILLSSPQYAILEVADRYVTGSSIMPQKRNPDFAEVTRAKAALIQTSMASLFGIARGALSGYNRDTQWTKYIIQDIFDEAMDAPVVFTGVFDTLQVNRQKAEASARQNFVNAVDVADALAQESGLPFRKTYEITSRAVKLSEEKGEIDLGIVRELAAEAGAKDLKLEIGSPMAIAERKRHEGGPAPEAVREDLKNQKALLQELMRDLRSRSSALERARSQMRQAAEKLK